MIGAGQHGGRGDDDEAADVVGGEVVVASGEVGVLGERLVHVVVVDQAGIDLAAADGGDDGPVVGERHGVVVGDPLQPLARRLVAQLEAHRRDEVLERCVRRGDAEAPRPLLAGQVEDARRQLLLRDDLGVEGEDALASGEADPTAVGGVELLGNEVEDVVAEGAEQAALIEVGDGARRLREEDIGRRLVSLLLDQQGEVGRVAVAHLDVDAGLLGKAVEDRLDEFLGASGVDDDGAPGIVAGSDRSHHSKRRRRGDQRCRDEFHVHGRHGRPSIAVTSRLPMKSG